jgi:hypothetical protein
MPPRDEPWWDRMSAIRNGTWLDKQVFPEPAWAVPGIIPEGCCILSGHPKIGKSFLVLAIALAAANGDEVLGVCVEQRPALYLALEDDARRLQHRARKLLDDRPLPGSSTTSCGRTGTPPWLSPVTGCRVIATASRWSSSTRWKRFAGRVVTMGTPMITGGCPEFRGASLFVKRHLPLLRRCSYGAGFVGDHDAPEVSGEVSFERTGGVSRWFSFGDLLVVVGAAGAGGHADLDHRDGVERGVQLPVSVTGEPMPRGISALDLDGRGAGVIRVRRG